MPLGGRPKEGAMCLGDWVGLLIIVALFIPPVWYVWHTERRK